MPRNVNVLNLSEARAMIDAALAKSDEIEVPVFVVVLDAFGQTVSSARADGANYFSERIAIGKARTAIGMGVSTETWEKFSESAPSFAGAITSVPDFTPFSGGLPVLKDGLLLGAIGVSGGTGAQDIEIVSAALAAFG